MKIAIVRGPSVTPWEMQAYTPLLQEHSLTAFSTSYSPFSIPADAPFPVVRCFWWDSILAPLHPKLRWLFNGMCSRLFGTSYYMHGLEKRLAGFDILHTLETHNTFSYQCARAKHRYGSKLVITVWETIPFRGQSHPLRTWRKRQTMRAADAYIAISERTRQMLITEGASPEKIHVIPMGIDCTHFSPRPEDLELRRQWGKDPDRFIILCVARLVKEKGVYDLIDAIHRLKQTIPGVRVVYVGSGPEKAGMKMKIAQLGLESQVIFSGFITYAQMPKAYATADCLVLPSVPTPVWEEQFGYALVEAMAMGLPVISTRSGAIPEVIGEAGILVQPGSVPELAQALSSLAVDRFRREQLSEQGRARAVRLFDARKIGGAMDNLYNSVKNPHP